MNPPTNRLGKDGYVRPKKTYTDKLSNDDILDKLDDYIEVKDAYKIPLGTHVRYFKILDDNKKKFCMGGTLFKNQGLPSWISLQNGRSSWSVQLDKAILYRKMTLEEIKNSYEKEIEDLEKKLEKMTGLASKYKKDRDQLLKKYS